jgi:hypothetical protein
MDLCAVVWLPRHEVSKRILGICCAIIFIYGPYVMSIFNWLGCRCVALVSCFCHCHHCLSCSIHRLYHRCQSKNCWIRTLSSSTSPRGRAGQPTRTVTLPHHPPQCQSLCLYHRPCLCSPTIVPSLSAVAVLLVVMLVTLMMITPVIGGR